MKTLCALFLGLSLLTGCGPRAGTAKKLKIGLSMDTLRGDRWAKDRDLFVKRCQELGAEVLVQSADSNDTRQVTQAENMLTQGLDALVVIPHNGKACATIVTGAHQAGVPVMAYDRMIMDSTPDVYVSFDNVKVGELQAGWLVKRRPKGNYALIGGAPTDNNAVLFRQGQMNVLNPYIKRGDIKIVGDQWARDWLAVEALKHVENMLSRNHNRIDAIVDSYDGTAGGSIQALAEQKLAGKVLISGQDAELPACQRIVEGTQSMTVYKPIRFLAVKAAEMAVKLAKKEPLTEATQSVNNGTAAIPSVLLEPIPVDKDNLVSTVIADGFQKMEDVYKNLPKDQWPAAVPAR